MMEAHGDRACAKRANALEEHKQIRAAREKLRAAAREENAYEQFAERLASHARTKEEILYRPSSSVTSCRSQ